MLASANAQSQHCSCGHGTYQKTIALHGSIAMSEPARPRVTPQAENELNPIKEPQKAVAVPIKPQQKSNS